MACGCNKSTVVAERFTWQGTNGQTVKNLTRIEAQARLDRKGGTITKQ